MIINSLWIRYWCSTQTIATHLGFYVENPTTIKQEFQEPPRLEDAQVDVDINDCKLCWIILANFVNGINAKKLLNCGKL